MSYITSLGYIGCNVSDLKAWDRFFAALYDIENFDETEQHTHRFHLGRGRQWVALQQSSGDGLAFIGWEVGSRASMDSIATLLGERGISVRRASVDLCCSRGAADLIQVPGPDGVAIELFLRAESAATGNTQKKPSSELELGHVVLAASDRRAAEAWYAQTLGFQLSDHIFWDGVEASFLRCNPRHHSLAITNPVGDMRGGDLGHFMLEVDSIDTVGQTYDRARRLGVPIAFTFGRHSNDGAISFYAYSPSGWLVEYGYGGRLIHDPAWQPALYDAPSIWGHELQPPPDDASGSKQRY